MIGHKSLKVSRNWSSNENVNGLSDMLLMSSVDTFGSVLEFFSKLISYNQANAHFKDNFYCTR